ncbi:MAG: hypothetical protein R3236_09305 [Phycisphaeraceae bacterium]|nr:hypothetical protein [Phycisphaeraceae bacterium]
MNAVALSAVVGDEAIRSVVAGHCGLASEDVTVAETDDGLPAERSSRGVDVFTSSMRGAFVFWLDIFAGGRVRSDADLAAAFVRDLQVEALVRDPTPNPYRFVHLKPPDGASTTVLVDGTRFDDHNTIVLLEDGSKR